MRTKLLLAFMLLAITAFGQQNPIQIDANGLTQTLASGGLVTRGQIVKINSAGQVVPMLSTDTSGAIGIAATSQQNAGQSIAVSIAGTPLIQIDSGGCTAGNVVSISSITAGAGHCAATASGQQIGIALSISFSGSNFWNVQLSPLSSAGATTAVPGSSISFGNTVSPLAYGGKWDVKFVYDATYTNGSATVTCPNNDCNFTAADVGKIAIGFEGPWSSNNGTSLYAALITNEATVLPTITAVNGAQSITLSATATQGCVAAAANFNVCTLAWGTQDDTAALNSAMVAAWETAGQCRALELPSGAAFISSSVLSPTISQLSSACGGQQGTTGGVDLNQTGPEIYGQGPNNSTLIPLPTFNFGSCTNGGNLNVCNLAAPNLEAHDFAINGLANSVGGTHNVVLVSLEGSSGGAGCTGSTGFNLTFTNWGVLASGSTGFQAGTNACGDPMYSNNISELFGATNCSYTTTFIMTIYANACFGAGGASAANFVATGSQAVLNSNNSFYGNSSGGNNNVNIGVSGGAVFNSKGDLIITNYGGPVSMVRVNGASETGTINLDGDIITVNANTTGLSYALLLQGSGGTTNVHIKGTQITATGANNRILLSSTLNNVFDDGGNTWTNGSQPWSVGGSFVADGHSVKGACTGTATSSVTLGLYGTGPNETLTTCTSAAIGSGIVVQGPRTLQNLIVTATHAGVNASSGVVTVLRNGVGTTITCTIGTGTSCVDTTHSVAVNDGDLISLQFTTQAVEVLAGVNAIVEWQ